MTKLIQTMKVKQLHKRALSDKKIKQKYSYFEKLIEAISQKDLPDDITLKVNQEVELLNASKGTEKQLKEQLSKSKMKLYKLLEKEVKIVPRSFYSTKWLAIGMAGFGIPLGIIFGISMDNMSLIGIGLPIGFTTGIAIGRRLDQKASDEGRQLDIDFA